MTTYDWLMGQLERSGARFRVIDHAPEGRTDLVSALRGHDVARAAELYFNAARLDRSVALNTDDYVRLAAPRLARITSGG